MLYPPLDWHTRHFQEANGKILGRWGRRMGSEYGPTDVTEAAISSSEYHEQNEASGVFLLRRVKAARVMTRYNSKKDVAFFLLLPLGSGPAQKASN